MDVSDYVSALRRQWKTVVAVLLLAVAVAGAVTLLTPKKYTADIAFYVGARAGSDPAAAYQAGLYATQRVTSYTELLTSDRIGASVATVLRGARAPRDIVSGIHPTAQPDSVLINVGVEGPAPQSALETAGALGQVFPDAVQDLERSTGQVGPPAVYARVVSAPVVDFEPSSPDVVLNMLLGVVFGVALGLAAALLRNAADGSLRGEGDVARAAGTEVVARIRRAGSPGGAGDTPADLALGEDFRRFRTALKQLPGATSRPVMSLVSPRAGDGRTSIVRSLAIAEARVGVRVVVVDADLRNPQIGPRFGVDATAGLAEILAGRHGVDDVIKKTTEPNVWVVPAGVSPQNPSDLLESARMRRLLDDLKQRFDLVLLDTPPTLDYADATVLTAYTELELLVVRYGETTRREVQETVQLLRAGGEAVTGAVLNMVPARKAPASRPPGPVTEAAAVLVARNGSTGGDVSVARHRHAEDTTRLRATESPTRRA